mgnify:CR=1 FL=1
MARNFLSRSSNGVSKVALFYVFENDKKSWWEIKFIMFMVAVFRLNPCLIFLVLKITFNFVQFLRFCSKNICAPLLQVIKSLISIEYQRTDWRLALIPKTPNPQKPIRSSILYMSSYLWLKVPCIFQFRSIFNFVIIKGYIKTQRFYFKKNCLGNFAIWFKSLNPSAKTIQCSKN